MIDFLCQNYPHLADKCLSKMSFISFQNLCKFSISVEHFTAVGPFHCFPDRISTQEINGDMTMIPMAEKKYTFVNKLIIDIHMCGSLFLERMPSFLKCLPIQITCHDFLISYHSKCFLSTKNQDVLLECIKLFNPYIVCEIVNPTLDFFHHPVMKNVTELELYFSDEVDVSNMKLPKDGLKKITMCLNVFPKQLFMEFIQDFLEGRQSIRRLDVTFFDIPPSFKENLCFQYAPYIIEYESGFLRLISYKEDAFVLITESRFIFRSVKRSTIDKLKPYFKMQKIDTDDFEYELPEMDNDPESYYDDFEGYESSHFGYGVII